MERRRILLLEVSPLVPQAPVFGTWDLTSITPAGKIALSNSNLTALYSGATTGTAGVRGSIIMQAGQWYWETRAEGTTTVNYTWTGIVRADKSIIAAGPDGACIAHSGDGRFVFRSLQTANVGQTPSSQRIAHWLDLDAGIYRVSKGGAWQVAASGLAAGAGWYPVMLGQFAGFGWSLCTGAPLSIFAPLQWAPPDSAQLYQAAPPPVRTTIYLGSEGFNTLPTDTPASTHYMGRLVGGPDGDVEIEREGGCWAWGNQTVSKRGRFVIANTDGQLDNWSDYIWRDAPAVAYSGYDGDARGAFTIWSRGVVDDPMMASTLSSVANRRAFLVAVVGSVASSSRM